MLTAIVRAPGPELAQCELTHVARAPIDAAVALDQHRAYCAALAELGARVVELPLLPEHPDAAFVEDAAVVLPDLAVIARPGSPARRGEVATVESALAGLRAELVRIEAPATLDGGDVLAMGEMLYVGQSSRTNHAGLKQLAHALLRHGYRVKAVEVRGCLHLKTACTALDDETLLVHRPCLNLERLAGLRLVDVPVEEPHGANVLRIGRTILVDAAAPRTAERIAGLGYAVRALEVSEFAKAEAGLTYLSLRVAG